MSREPNTVFIGRKPPMNYVLAVITSFNSGNAKDITLKARGRAITTAVDVAEIVKRRFIKDLQITSVVTGTEEIQTEEGGKRTVSTIEIKLTV